MNWFLLGIIITWFGYDVWAGNSKKNNGYKEVVGFVLLGMWVVVGILMIVASN